MIVAEALRVVRLTAARKGLQANTQEGVAFQSRAAGNLSISLPQASVNSSAVPPVQGLGCSLYSTGPACGPQGGPGNHSRMLLASSAHPAASPSHSSLSQGSSHPTPPTALLGGFWNILNKSWILTPAHEPCSHLSTLQSSLTSLISVSRVLPQGLCPC